MMKWKGRESTNILFINLKQLLRLLLFIYFHLAEWLWAVYLSPLISSFLICKIEVITVFTSNVILRIKRNIACEMLNTRLDKKCSDRYYCLWMSSEFSQQSLKKKAEYNMLWCSITEAIRCSKQSWATLPTDHDLLSEAIRWIVSHALFVRLVAHIP